MRWRGAFGGLEAGLAGLIPRTPQPAAAALRQTGFHLLSLAGFGLVVAGMIRSGRPVIGMILGRSTEPLLAAGLGVAAASALWVGLGLAGLARTPVAALWVAALAAAGCPLVVRAINRRSGLPGLARAWWPALAMLAVLLPPALCPESEVDSLTYHLALPDGYARAGKIFLAPGSLLDGYWQGQEALHLPALLLGSEPGAKLVSLAAALLLAAGAVALGRSRLPGPALPWLAATVLAAPPVMQAATRSKNDALAAALVLAALVARAGGAGLRRAAAAGLLAGAAAGVKSTAAIALPPLLLTFALAGPGGRVAPALVALAAAALPVAPWLARNGLALGNPVFPALLGWLPAPGLSALHRIRSDRYLYVWADAAPRNAVDAVAALIAVAGGAAPAIGAGLLLLPFAPGALRVARVPALFAAAFLPVWLLAFPWLFRFALPAIAPLAVLAWIAIAAGPAASRIRLAGGLTLAGGLLVALGSPAWTTRPLWCALGVESREAFSDRAGRTWAEAVHAVERSVPADQRVLVFGEWKSYPSGGRLVAPWIADTPPAIALAARGGPERIAVALRQRQITHALINVSQAAYWAAYAAEFPWTRSAAGRWAAYWDAHATLTYASVGPDSSLGFFVLVGLNRRPGAPPFRAWLPGLEGEFVRIKEAAAADPADPGLDPELRRVRDLFGPRAEVLARSAGVAALRGRTAEALAGFRAATAAAPEGIPVWANLSAVPVSDATRLAAFIREYPTLANMHMALGVPTALPRR